MYLDGVLQIKGAVIKTKGNGKQKARIRSFYSIYVTVL